MTRNLTLAGFPFPLGGGGAGESGSEVILIGGERTFLAMELVCKEIKSLIYICVINYVHYAFSYKTYD